MPETLTNDRLHWAQEFTGITINVGTAAGAGASAPGAAAGGAGQPGGAPDQTANPAAGGDPAEPGNILEDIGEGIAHGAQAVGHAIVHGAEVVGGAIVDGAKAVGRALGILPPKPIIPPILAPEQQKRVDAAAAKLPPEDKKKYQAMLDGAKNDKEKQYIEKGLAAGHTIAELQAFQGKIAGKDEKWMQDNLSLTGNSDGKGIKQQWSMSCNATTAEAVRGQMDPLYALKMHEDNPDVTKRNDDDGAKANPNMAAEQKAMLESADPSGHKGVARSEHDPTDPHTGRWNTDLLNKDSGSTGVSYTNKRIGDGPDEVNKAVDDIAGDVEKGMPVPIVIGDGGAHKFAHYVLVTAVDPGPPKAFSIHDPANGTTEVRTVDELKGGKIDLAGQNKGGGWMKIGAYEKPTPVPVK